MENNVATNNAAVVNTETTGNGNSGLWIAGAAVGGSIVGTVLTIFVPKLVRKIFRKKITETNVEVIKPDSVEPVTENDHK